MKLTPEEIEHIKKRRLTQKLWETFTQEKCPMSWYKENTPIPSPFISKTSD
jgi:hypothetical protein|tara:strand:+ start:73 stop:225 length:153 start_codon:yes stop_codon:yes gene_type:complete